MNQTKKTHILHKITTNIEQSGQETALVNDEAYFGIKEISWQKLGEYTFNLGSFLMSDEINIEGENIAIISQNCLQWTCADLAILFAKFISTPIYKTVSINNLNYIQNNAEINTFFIDDVSTYELIKASLKDKFLDTNIIVFDDSVELVSDKHFKFNDLIKQSRCHKKIKALKQNYKLEDIATLIYTSGTSGDPKGVLLSHNNIASSISQHTSWVNFKAQDKSLAILPLSHIFERNWTFYVMCAKGFNYYLNDYLQTKEAIKSTKPQAICVVPRFLEKIYSALLEQTKTNKLLQYAFFINKKHQKNPQSKLYKALFNINKASIFKLIKQKIFPNIKIIPCGGATLDKDIVEFFQKNDFPLLVGYGLTETTATVTSQRSHINQDLNCGQSLGQVKIKINQDNEIMVKSETVMRGYYKNDKANSIAFKEGWFRTGDAGVIDEKGNLTITDRIKDLMKTSNGKYIAPQKIESMLSLSPFIEQIAVVAEAKHFVSALIVPKFNNLEKWAKEHNIYYKDKLDLAKNTKVQEKITKTLYALQEDLASFEKVKKFTLLINKFSIELGELTPTFKLRRKFIYKKYESVIQNMYKLS